MRRLLTLVLMVVTTNCFSQYGYCLDDSYVSSFQSDTLTYVWVEDVTTNCHYTKDHSIYVFCRNGNQPTKYKMDIGDTLILRIGINITYISVITNHYIGNDVYQQQYPNISITGFANVECNEEYLPIPVNVPKWNLIDNKLTVTVSAALVLWDFITGKVEVIDLIPGQTILLDTGICFFLVFEDGSKTIPICL